MKNKKKKDFSSFEILVILVGIFGVVCIIVLIIDNIINLTTADFVVTEEVCHQEEIVSLDFPDDFEVISCPNFINTTNGVCYINNITGYLLLQEGYNYTKYAVLNYTTNLSKEVCETQEVENIFGIELITDKWFYPNRDGIDWLKENCECIDKPYGVSVCKWNVPDDCIIDRSITGLYTVNSSRPECLNCGQEYVFPEDCTQFKCGEYTVEKLK